MLGMRRILGHLWSENIARALEQHEVAGAAAAAAAGASNSTTANDEWREQVELNRQQLFACGLWGVPSMRCTNCNTHDTIATVWGQDRLWLLDAILGRQQRKSDKGQQ
jgi:2-hydroxychromene-2-carboxylate isomerase